MRRRLGEPDGDLPVFCRIAGKAKLDVVTVLEAGLSDVSDPELIAWASSENRLILTARPTDNAKPRGSTDGNLLFDEKENRCFRELRP